jgi:cytoskeletal protein CcmA (bactofilin family)
MAQIVQLKRSSLSGKVPDTGSLNLGELAINTFDGKIYLRRSGSTDTVQEVITTNTTNTGSINLIGNQTITGSLQVSGSATIMGSLTMAGNISASVNNLYNIGSPSFRFNQIFLGGAIYLNNSGVKGNALTFGDETGVIFMKIGSLVTGGNIGIYGSGSTYVDNGSRLQILASGFQNALYVSGSSQFTGSIIQSGSLTSIGPSTFIGNITQTGSLSVSGDITVLGAVNARQFNIGIISSSILYQSGSTKFGDTSDDTMQVTGSLQISGSQTITGSITATSHIGLIAATNGVISGSSQLTSSFDTRYNLSGSSGASPGPNTFDFNLDPQPAGTINYITDTTSNTLALAQTGSFDVKISNITRLSVSSSAMWVTTGSITSNYMHLAKYINTAGDLDFNI